MDHVRFGKRDGRPALFYFMVDFVRFGFCKHGEHLGALWFSRKCVVMIHPFVLGGVSARLEWCASSVSVHTIF